MSSKIEYIQLYSAGSNLAQVMVALVEYGVTPGRSFCQVMRLVDFDMTIELRDNCVMEAVDFWFSLKPIH